MMRLARLFSALLQKRVVHIPLLLSWLLLSAVPVAPTPARERIAVDAAVPPEAAAAIEAGDWEQVMKVLEPLAKETEPGEPVHYWYGLALHHQDNTSMSLKHLNAALELNPASKLTAHQIARVALAHSIVVEPEQLAPALAAFPNDPLVLTAVGAIEHEQYARHYKPRKDDTVAWCHLEQAQDYLRRAIALDPASVTARFEMVETLEKLEQWDRAIEHLLIADSLEPLGHEAYVMLGQLYDGAADYSAAADAYALAIEMAPAQTQKVERERAEALLNARRYDEAVEAFRIAFNANIMDRTVRFMLGQAAYEAGDYPLALYCFQESLRVDNNADALVWSAKCAYDMEQDKLAVKLVNQAIEMRKERQGDDVHIPALWRFVRGRALWQLGEKKAAMEDLDKASEFDGGNWQYARWAIYAARQLNDPYSVVRAAKNYGNEADPWEAMRVIRQVQSTWTWFPPRKDFRGQQYRRGLAGEVSQAIAEMYDKMNQPVSAAVMCQSAGWHGKGRVNIWSAWIRFRGGMIVDARTMFDRLARNGASELTKQKGHGALALIALMYRDPNAVRTHAQFVNDRRYKPSTTTLLKRADILSGRAGAVDTLDTFDLLGTYGSGLDGQKFQRGWYVRALLPKSPLAQTRPPVRGKDVIIRVGKRHLGTLESIKNLRRDPVPEGNAPVLVRRGKQTFEVMVDFAAARAALADEKPDKEEHSS